MAEPLLVSGYEGIKAREAKVPATSKIHLTAAGTADRGALRLVGQARPGSPMAREARAVQIANGDQFLTMLSWPL